MKYSIYIVWLLLLVSGCRNEEWVESSTQIAAKISTRYANGIGIQVSAGVDHAINTLSGYVCEGGAVKWMSHDLKSETGDIWLPGEYKEGTLYLVANKSLCADIDRIALNAPESELIELNSRLSEYKAPSALLMTNVISIASLKAQDSPIINLRRNVARVDLSLGKEVTLHSITINGIPVSGTVFAAEVGSASVETESYTATFGVDQPAAEQTLFYCQELAANAQTPLTITVDALYNGVRAKSQATLGAIQRNYIYRLLVSAPNGIITSDITYADMESGDDVTVDKPEQTPLLIDPANSTIPFNCKFSDDKSRITFDFRGGEATIALTGDSSMKFISAHGSIKDFSVTPQADGRFLIKVGSSKTEIGTDNPAAVLYFAAEEDKDDPSRYQSLIVTSQYFAPFDVVTIGGMEWMQANSSSTNPQSYLAVEKNREYKELYKGNWNAFGGKGFQWGPRPGHSKNGYVRMAAWEATGYGYPGLGGVNGSIIGGNECKAWNGFCPEGWRLPKSSEFARIWPSANTVLTNTDAAYETSYGKFTARIEKLGNNCLIISDGINELIFPIAGFRSADGVNNGVYNYLGWGVGIEAYYWCNDRVGGNAPVYGIKSSSTSVVAEHNPANWNQVRCVRDIIE